MKYILLIMVLIMTFSCQDHSKEFYYNLNLKVESMGENTDEAPTKHRELISVKSMLLKDTINNTYCVITNKWNNSDNSVYIPISNEKWFNTKVGDVLYFDYIRKDRFFKIKK